ncbi:hypothetical protein CLOM_g16168, partial [Closterium sp. NIES-68]
LKTAAEAAEQQTAAPEAAAPEAAAAAAEAEAAVGGGRLEGRLGLGVRERGMVSGTGMVVSPPLLLSFLQHVDLGGLGAMAGAWGEGRRMEPTPSLTSSSSPPFPSLQQHHALRNGRCSPHPHLPSPLCSRLRHRGLHSAMGQHPLWFLPCRSGVVSGKCVARQSFLK